MGYTVTTLQWDCTQQLGELTVFDWKTSHFLALNINVSKTEGDAAKVTIND